MKERKTSRVRQLTAPLLAATAAILLGCGDAAVQPTERPLLWRIAGAEKPSYLYGTIHLPDPRVTTLPADVEHALAASDVVLTELSLTPASMIEMARAMQLPNDKGLADVLPPAVLGQLEEYVRSKSFPFPRLAKMKIWAAMITIEAIDLAKAGNPEVLDQVLVRLARDAGKQCEALETVAEQVAVFDSFSTVEQTSLLKTSLDTLQRMQRAGENPAEELLRIYLAGDALALLEAATKCDTPGADADLQARFVKAVLTERNERMAERIVERLRQHPDQVAFFAIGAAHCAGERGVLALLEKAGYAATRIGDQASSSAAAAAAGALAPR